MIGVSSELTEGLLLTVPEEADEVFALSLQPVKNKTDIITKAVTAEIFLGIILDKMGVRFTGMGAEN